MVRSLKKQKIGYMSEFVLIFLVSKTLSYTSRGLSTELREFTVIPELGELA